MPSYPSCRRYLIAVSPGSRLPPLPTSNRVCVCVVFSRRLGYHRSARSTTFKGPINEYSSHDGSDAADFKRLLSMFVYYRWNGRTSTSREFRLTEFLSINCVGIL